MKQLVLITILFLFSQTTFAQIKVQEYERTNQDLEKARIDVFVVNLLKEPESKGLIVIYGGEKGQQLVAIHQDIKAIRNQLNFRLDKSDKDRIFFKISEGKPPLYKEFWIYPKGLELPRIEPKLVNLDSLKTNFHFASVCASCEDAIEPLSTDFIDFELYANLLRQYPGYKSLIVIYPNTFDRWSRKERYQDALNYAATYRNILVKGHKISNNRITIRIGKQPVDKNNPTLAVVYIIPDK